MKTTETIPVLSAEEKHPKVLAVLRSLGLPPEQTGDVTITLTMNPASVVMVEINAHVFVTEDHLDKLIQLLSSDEAKVNVVRLSALVSE